MATIKTDTKEAILNGVNRYLRSIDAHMDIYQMCRGRNRTVKVGVNWAACGTVPPEEAKRFADVLNGTAHICEVINAYQWTEEWGSDYETEDDYRRDVNGIYAGLCAGRDIKELVDLII